MEPHVTVLMPVYNGESHLREAIDSILQQSYASFELLVVDDGSNDKTAHILSEYSDLDHRVRVVTQKNSGIVAALNIGLEQARGAYIARMDADDVAYPHRLRTQVDYLDTHPNCVACGSDYQLFGARSGRVKTPRTNGECKAKLLMESCFAHPTVMLRTKTLRQTGLQYEAIYQYAEDYRLWTRLAEHGEFGNIEQVLLKYRVHPGQVSSVKKLTQRERHARAAADYARSMGLRIVKEEFTQLLWPDSLRLTRNYIWSAVKLVHFASKIRKRESTIIAADLAGRLIRSGARQFLPKKS